MSRVKESKLGKDEYEKIKGFYEINAEGYEHNRWFRNSVLKFDYLATKESITREMGKIKSNSIALEVGCGAGTWTKVISPYTKKTVAIDIAKNMIKEAERIVSLNNVSFRSINFLEFSSTEFFDLIICIRVIEHISEKELFFKKAFELLDKKGKIIVVTKMTPSIWRGRYKINRILQKLFPEKLSLDPTYTPQGKQDLFSVSLSSPFFLRKTMKKIGFSNIRIKPVIVRLPIFRSCYGEYPIIPKKYEKRVLSFSKSISEKIHKHPFLEALSLFIAESYVIRGIKD